MSIFALEACRNGVHIWSLKPLSRSRYELRTERARRRTGQASISRMLDAMHDGGLAVMTVGRALAINCALPDTAGMGGRYTGRCDSRGLLDVLLGRRFSRVCRTATQGFEWRRRADGSLPTGVVGVLVLFIER